MNAYPPFADHRMQAGANDGPPPHQPSLDKIADKPEPCRTFRHMRRHTSTCIPLVLIAAAIPLDEQLDTAEGGSASG